jgi:hypothetical protein
MVCMGVMSRSRHRAARCKQENEDEVLDFSY